MGERKVYIIRKDGVMVPVPDDYKVWLEEECVRRVGSLNFTPHDEMELFEDKLNRSIHAKKTELAMLRREAGLLLGDMAKLLQISKDGYYKIESGVSFPRLQLALKMAKLFDVSVEELFIVD